MSQQDKLRQSLRSHYDTRPYSFGEADWQKVLALRKTNRRKRILWVSACALLLSVVTAILFLARQQTMVSRQEAVAARDFQVPAPAVKKPASACLQPVIARAPARSALRVQVSQSNAFPPANDQTPPEVLQSTREPAASSEATMNPPPESQGDNTATEPAGIGHAREESEHWSAQAEGIIRSYPGDSANPMGLTITGPPPASAELNPEIKEQEVVPADTADHEQSHDIVATAMETASRQSVTDPLHTKPAVEDSAKTQAGEWPEPVTFLPAAEEGLYFDAGAAWLKGWSSAGGNNGRGLSPVGGFGYLKRIDRQCGLGFGITYLRVSRLSASGKTSRISSYTFGEESKVTVITPLTAHYLQAPLRFHYRLSRIHTMGGGIILSWLQDVVATVTTYEEKPGSRTNYRTVKLGRYRDGFLPYDSQLSLFYGARICRGIVLQAELFFGLTDIKDNRFFGVEQVERNSGASLRVMYYPLRKVQK